MRKPIRSERPPVAPPTAQPRPYTLAEMQPPAVRGGEWRRIPQITARAVRLVWRAAPRQFLATIALQVLSAVTLGAILLIGRHLLAGVIIQSQTSGSLRSLVPAFIALIGATAVGGLLAALIAHQQRLLTELVGRYAMDEIIDVSTVVELESFDDAVFHDQLERARTSGLFRPIEIVNSLISLMTGLLTSTGVAVALASLEPRFVPIVLVAGVPVFLATMVNSGQAYSFEYAITPQSRERAYLMELLTRAEPAKELRVFGATSFLRRRYDGLTDDRIAELRKYLRRRLRVALTGTGGGSLGAALALGALAYMLATGRIGVATAMAAGVAMQILAGRLTMLTGSIGKLVESGMFLDDFHTFLGLAAANRRADEDRDSARAALPAPSPRSEGLVVEGVSFTYPQIQRTVLHDISLEVAPGEIVALVGENGSGKTTLVKLICQLYRPQTGRISWKGVDLGVVGPKAIRDDMTVIFQDFIQYHLSALENISLGRVEREAIMDDIVAAAQQAGADTAIAGLPEGYDTRLGRQFYGGHELSVGQWQRLALARAFFRGGDFLVLDEPTAALDPRAEHEQFTQMRELAAGRSVLLISHRFSSVRSADRIYVLHGGRIIESGSHEELLEQDGHYAELFALQAEAYLGESRSTSPR